MLLTIIVFFFQKNRPENISESSPELQEDHLPTVTMVISAYNEEDILEDKIQNCQAIDYPTDKIKFLIGSDGSSDRTNDILKSITDERFQTIHSYERRGKVQMLNQLMGMVESQLVVFSDANTMYQTIAVKELVRKFDQENIGCVIGKLDLTVPQNDDQACQTEGLYWRYENKIKILESCLGIVPSINGGIFAIRTELFETLPAQSITEDQVLGMKIMTKGYRCVLAQKAQATENVSNFSGELKRRIRISAGNFQSLFLVPKILNPSSGPVSFAFISHKFLRWMVPFCMMVVLMSNLLLAGEIFYGSTLLLQGLFYGCGLISTALPKVTAGFKVLTIPKYFLAMNIAILIGFMRFISKRQQVTWNKAARL